jgi:putative inorganic carbon (HCO3(-)) transporter
MLLVFAFIGFRHTYIALCGVVFVDLLKPQLLSHSFLSNQPLSLIITLLFFTSIIFNFKQLSKPEKLGPSLVLVLFMVWITISTQLAEFQYAAWIKYDYVIKTMLLSLFIPFVINTRVKIDTFIATVMCCISYYSLTVGIKTLFTGGGYYNQFFSSSINVSMSESSTLSMISTMNILLIVYLYRYSVFKAKTPILRWGAYFISTLSFLAVIGTYARTGLIGLFMLAALYLKNSKKKIRILLISTICIGLLFPLLPEPWLDRMDTISNASEESSAYGRIVVWKWTIDYANDNPIFGGGFQSYFANAGQLDKYVTSDIQISRTLTGKAYHNIFFEVLGEQGYGGLFIYLFIIYMIFMMNRKVMKKSNTNNWEYQLATVITNFVIIYCVCGMFIGVAFYPWIFYMLGLSVSLHSIRPNTGKVID